MNNWHEVVGEAVKHLIPFFKSETGPAGPDDNPTSTHASIAKSHGAQMPRTASPRYLTRNVRDYVEYNDNVPCDPIEVSLFQSYVVHSIKQN